ncbi:MAG: response regulator [Pseudomonadota bacterium]
MAETDILVLEDEMLIALDIEATLQDAGYESLKVCTSVAETEHYLQDHLPAVALLDINLGRDGTSFELGRTLLARGCPLLFMTGYTQSTVGLPDELSDARRIAKPFSAHELLEGVAGLLAKAPAAQ